MKKKVFLILLICFIVCVIPVVETCKCGATTVKSIIYCIRKDNVDFSGIYEYSVDVFGINVYTSANTSK